MALDNKKRYLGFNSDLEFRLTLDYIENSLSPSIDTFCILDYDDDDEHFGLLSTSVTPGTETDRSSDLDSPQGTDVETRILST